MHSSTPYLSRQQRRASTQVDWKGWTVALARHGKDMRSAATDSGILKVGRTDLDIDARRTLRHRHRFRQPRHFRRVCSRHLRSERVRTRSRGSSRNRPPAPGSGPDTKPRQRRLTLLQTASCQKSRPGLSTERSSIALTRCSVPMFRTHFIWSCTVSHAELDGCRPLQ